MAESKGAVLRLLWRDKMHIEPSALELAPASIRATYDHSWQPAEILMADLQVLPSGLLDFWQTVLPGHLVFTHRSSQYKPGPQPWRDSTLYGLCELSIVELRQDKGRVFRALFNLLDHLLGSTGVVGGAWLSDGTGITANLRLVGERLVRIYALGHWRGEFPVQNGHDYLAWAWWTYLKDLRHLNTVDPLVFRLLASTLMSERFWMDRG